MILRTGGIVLSVSQRLVSLSPPWMVLSSLLSAEGLGRQCFQQVCLLSVDNCACFSATEQLQQDVVTSFHYCLHLAVSVRHLGRNLNRKYFIECKVHFSSKAETINVKPEKQMADKSKIQFIQEAQKLMQHVNNPVAWMAALFLIQQDHPTLTEHKLSCCFYKVPLDRGSCCSSWLLHL